MSQQFAKYSQKEPHVSWKSSRGRLRTDSEKDDISCVLALAAHRHDTTLLDVRGNFLQWFSRVLTHLSIVYSTTKSSRRLLFAAPEVHHPPSIRLTVSRCQIP